MGTGLGTGGSADTQPVSSRQQQTLPLRKKEDDNEGNPDSAPSADC